MIARTVTCRVAATVLLLHLCWTASATSVIRREISISGNSVRVTDYLSLSPAFANKESNLGYAFDAGMDHDTNFVHRVQKLFGNDDLQMVECVGQRHGESLEIKIVSTVRFAASNNEAKIHLVPTFAGVRIGADTVPGKHWDELTIFKQEGKFVVYLSEVDSFEPSFQQFEKDGDSFDTFFKSDGQFECILKTGKQTVPLMTWDLRAHDSNAPSLAVMRHLAEFHKMTGNDQLALCTSLKLAKPGYYLLVPGAETNQVHTPP
jgi:hypothetical protein